MPDPLSQIPEARTVTPMDTLRRLERVYLLGAIVLALLTILVVPAEGLRAPWVLTYAEQAFIPVAIAVAVAGVVFVCVTSASILLRLLGYFGVMFAMSGIAYPFSYPNMLTRPFATIPGEPNMASAVVYAGLVLLPLLWFVVSGILGLLVRSRPSHQLRRLDTAGLRRAGIALLLWAGLWIGAVRIGIPYFLHWAISLDVAVWGAMGPAWLGASLLIWTAPLSPLRGPGQDLYDNSVASETFALPGRTTRQAEPTLVSPLSLHDVILPERTRAEMTALIRMIADPASGKDLGVVLPQGAILYGPPGTGKTMISRAIAGETKRKMLVFNASALTSMWAGEGAQLVRSMFEQAREQAPCILFIDEIDSITRERSASNGSGGAGATEAARMGEFLAQIEGVGGALADVFIVGATNRLDDIDPAVRSRLGYHIEILLPDEPARAAILHQHFPAKTDTTPEAVASTTSGLSGRELRELCHVAGTLALAENATAVSRSHFDLALSRVQAEPGAHASHRAEPSRVAQASFSDLILPKGTLNELQTLVGLMTDPTTGVALGVQVPAGCILYGPPGTGKTLIARAVAGESKRPVLAFSGAAITSMWAGEGSQLVRDMFRQARSAAPCVLFIDELDGIVPARQARGLAHAGATQDATQQINQFLQELEGVGGPMRGVFVIGATNYLDAIDEAVRSRLSYQVAIPLPDLAARAAILRMNFPPSAETTPEAIAELTEGYSGRDLRELCRITGVIALSDHATAVTLDAFRRAQARVRGGHE